MKKFLYVANISIEPSRGDFTINTSLEIPIHEKKEVRLETMLQSLKEEEILSEKIRNKLLEKDEKRYRNCNVSLSLIGIPLSKA